MRVKKMCEDEFRGVLKLEWEAVELREGSLPKWAANIPGQIVYVVAASGTAGPGSSYHSKTISSGTLIGGIDVWREAPDDPVDLNKDWYAVVSVDGHPQFLVDGPFKDDNHWADEVPDRLKGIQVLGVPKAEPPS